MPDRQQPASPALTHSQVSTLIRRLSVIDYSDTERIIEELLSLAKRDAMLQDIPISFRIVQVILFMKCGILAYDSTPPVF